MKITPKQKIKKIEEWLDKLREQEQVETIEKDNLTLPFGSTKVFLDKKSKNNDKIQMDYIVIKRSELSMLTSSMLEPIFKLASK